MTVNITKQANKATLDKLFWFLLKIGTFRDLIPGKIGVFLENADFKEACAHGVVFQEF
jgi:hypothetical protein